MPQLTPEQEDSLFEAVSRQLFRMNNVVKGMFGDELSDEELARAHSRVMEGVNQAMAKQRQPLQTTQPFPAAKPIDMSKAAEGGFVNDQSGMASALERKRLGIR